MKFKYLFGPVPSRRLGISLGIDLIPSKVCTQNCIYCEVGVTTVLTLDRREYIPINGVIEELDQFLLNKPELDYITFSGSGEPTLNSGIGKLLKYIKKNYPSYKIACITNSSLLWNENVRNELMDIDVMLPSLDTVSESAFKRLNCPHPDLTARKLLNGLIKFSSMYKGKIWLEIFLSPEINDNPHELSLIKNACSKIDADRIQLNTLDRPGIVKGLKPLSNRRLKEVADFLKPLPIEIIAKAKIRQQKASFDHDVNNHILELIKRRPCTDEDLRNILGLHINELNKYLGSLLSSGKIREIEEVRGVFFEINKPEKRN